MVDVGKTQGPPQPEKQADEHKPEKKDTVDWNADKAAKRAGNREKDYDQKHDIFKE